MNELQHSGRHNAANFEKNRGVVFFISMTNEDAATTGAELQPTQHRGLIRNGWQPRVLAKNLFCHWTTVPMRFLVYINTMRVKI